MIEIEDEDEDFLSQIAAVEADAICNKRFKITPIAPDTVHSGVKTEDENAVEGAYTAALKGSKSVVWQQQKTTHSTTFDAHRNRGSSQGTDGIGGMAIGGSDSSVPEKMCPCGSGACPVRTSNTEKNPGRKFYVCPIRQDNGGCGFFEWCDNSSRTDNVAGGSQHYAPSSLFPELPCPCGAGPCLILTAKTEKNVGRQFYRCPINKENGGCGFFEWCDNSSSNAAAPGPPPVNSTYKVHNTTDKRYSGSQHNESSSLFPELPCPCGDGSCVILTAKTEKNLGRQFYRCPANQGVPCGFFKWCNELNVETPPSGKEGRWSKDFSAPSYNSSGLKAVVGGGRSGSSFKSGVKRQR